MHYSACLSLFRLAEFGERQMKRPVLITVVNFVQTLLGLGLAGVAVYLLALTRSKQTLAEEDAAEVVRGLLIGALVLGIPAVITLIAAVGLWKARFWGWVLSLATDVGLLSVLVYSMADENSVESDEMALAAAVVVPLVLLLLPVARKYFWTSSRAAQVA